MVSAKSKKIDASDGTTASFSSSESRNQSKSKNTKKNLDTLQETKKNNKSIVNQPQRKTSKVPKPVIAKKDVTSSNNRSFVAKRTRSNKSRKLESLVSPTEPMSTSSSIKNGSKANRNKKGSKNDVQMNDENISESKLNAKNKKEIIVNSIAKPNIDSTKTLTKVKNPKNKTTVKQSENQVEPRNSSEPIETENENVATRPGTRKRRITPSAENKDKQINETTRNKRKEKVPRLDSKDKLETNRPKEENLKKPAHNAVNKATSVTSREKSGSKTKFVNNTSPTSSNDEIKKSAPVIDSKVEETQKQKVALKKDDIAQLLENDDDEYR